MFLKETVRFFSGRIFLILCLLFTMAIGFSYVTIASTAKVSTDAVRSHINDVYFSTVNCTKYDSNSVLGNKCLERQEEQQKLRNSDERKTLVSSLAFNEDLLNIAGTSLFLDIFHFDLDVEKHNVGVFYDVNRYDIRNSSFKATEAETLITEIGNIEKLQLESLDNIANVLIFFKSLFFGMWMILSLSVVVRFTVCRDQFK